MKRRTILIFLALILSFTAYSKPARKGMTPLIQPDGTVFYARMKGDEFMRITTTTDGNAIMQDEDGWWCYAVFDNDGNRACSGWKVGDKAPLAILSESRMIPYATLSEAARERRASRHYVRPATFSISPDTKSTDTKIKHGIVILAQFSDVEFTYGRQDFVDLLTKEGYSRNGASGSAKEYFDAQFGGRADFRFDVSSIITLPGKRSEYGGNLANGQDRDPSRMIIEACRAADEEIDFSMYDDDKDGEIDNVFIFFAGEDEAEGAGEDCIWAHSWYVFEGAGKSVVLDGKILDRYACSAELTRKFHLGLGTGNTLTSIGTFCHEYAHTLGLPDLYDTDYDGSGGEAAAVWAWTSLMDGGNENNHGNTPPSFNAIERELLGICDPIRIKSDGTYALGPIDRTNTAYRLDTDNENEYYLIECRSGKGWDGHVGGSGMLIYHIDRSDRASGYSNLYRKNLKASERWEPANEVNCRPDHQCADLIEADGRSDHIQSFRAGDQYQNISTIFFPQEGITSISHENFRFWSGTTGSADISDIILQDDVIRFRISNTSGSPVPPDVSDVEIETFPDAAIIRFRSEMLFDGNAIVEWGRTAGAKQSTVIQAYEPGKFAILLEDLVPDNKTYEVSICFEAEGIKGESYNISFMTRKAPDVDWPYIYMNGVARNSDGTIPHDSPLPLRVINARDAAEITWSFNGKQIAVDGDQYYRVTGNGTLKAHIIWKNGGEDTIIKEIISGKEE